MSENGHHTAVERGGFDPHRVFSQILAGELPAAFVFRNSLVSAFMDIQPINPGHVLVVPNEQASCLAELPPETGAEIFRVGQRVAAAIRATTLKCEGINLFLADGVVAGQTVFHVHLHVFPRFVDDGFRWKLPTSYDTPPSREEIEANRDLISQLMKDEL